MWSSSVPTDPDGDLSRSIDPSRDSGSELDSMESEGDLCAGRSGPEFQDRTCRLPAGQHLQDCWSRVVATERLRIQCARNANQLQAELTPSLVLGKSSNVNRVLELVEPGPEGLFVLARKWCNLEKSLIGLETRGHLKPHFWGRLTDSDGGRVMGGHGRHLSLMAGLLTFSQLLRLGALLLSFGA